MVLVPMDLSSLFPSRAEFEPAADFEPFRKLVPARWVVYLMADADDRPVQLLCVKNLRYSIERRLHGEESIGPSKRVNYREIVRRIYYRRVDSAFEADVVYLEAARQLFPESYQGMVGFRPAWFIHVDPEATFPRYTKTIDLLPRAGTFIGPGVLMFIGGVRFFGNQIDGDGLWVVDTDRGYQGAIAIQNCSFTNCRFVNVGLATDEAFVREIYDTQSQTQ